jgi:hypothetical protein
MNWSIRDLFDRASRGALDFVVERGVTHVDPEGCYNGPFRPLTAEEQEMRDRLHEHINALATDIGIRDPLKHYRKYCQAGDYVAAQLTSYGFHVSAQEYSARRRRVRNLVAKRRGTDPSLPALLVGAHYDSMPLTPGANDNGTGVASLLEIARLLKTRRRPRRSVIFVAFTNEEPPFFQTAEMGSLVFANRLKAKNFRLKGMICLETIGYYTRRKNTQKVHAVMEGTYRSLKDDYFRGDFIGFFGNSSSIGFLTDVLRKFRQYAQFPSEGLASPVTGMGIGLDLSDHWSFWQCGYDAIMVTDTAMMRYRWYHTRGDTPDRIRYKSYARVTLGLYRAVEALAAR